jgi:hypothetical protein
MNRDYIILSRAEGSCPRGCNAVNVDEFPGSFRISKTVNQLDPADDSL